MKIWGCGNNLKMGEKQPLRGLVKTARRVGGIKDRMNGLS